MHMYIAAFHRGKDDSPDLQNGLKKEPIVLFVNEDAV